MLIKNYHITESSFGGSTSCRITLENNIVKDVVNTSSNSTNYMWDGWDPEFLKSLKGKTEKEVDYIMETLFDDWDDEHRTPFVIRGDQTLVR